MTQPSGQSDAIVASVFARSASIMRVMYTLLSSFGLAGVLFLFLLLLTYLGTLDQVRNGLFHAQRTYFASWFLFHPVYGIPVPLPGAMLLLVLLFVNILLGALSRIPRSWAECGMFMVHGGILVLLLGAAISYRQAYGGYMLLAGHAEADHFESNYDWELLLQTRDDSGNTREIVVPGNAFMYLHPNEMHRRRLDGIPCEIELFGYQPNATPAPADSTAMPSAPVVDGYVLAPLPMLKEFWRNAAGLYVRLVPLNGAERPTAFLSGASAEPMGLAIPGVQCHFTLRRQRWSLPFRLRLDNFTHEFYPGTNTPHVFNSELTRTAGDLQEDVRIGMNQPMRYKGYIVYQASWGPQDAAPGAELFTVLAVSRNPADRFPLYACVCVALGMLLHFASKLLRHLRHASTGAMAP